MRKNENMTELTYINNNSTMLFQVESMEPKGGGRWFNVT